ncbi:hypothetical protein TNIN_355601 [Trichonephila inaurata madagascariensis]|uniref:Uncharacterized protein n=1 Tax=Trichonephila inaurata madagascariensis TaxID=2747483 RepID=A0A8X7BVT9_9ARAC|nr:hypothetical protein TNIN_355601 [Trichonephila inaurata madagascariensis]
MSSVRKSWSSEREDYRNLAPRKPSKPPHPFGIASKISLGLRGEFSNTSSPSVCTSVLRRTHAKRKKNANVFLFFIRISAYHVLSGESIIFAVRNEHASANLMIRYRQISK